MKLNNISKYLIAICESTGLAKYGEEHNFKNDEKLFVC